MPGRRIVLRAVRAAAFAAALAGTLAAAGPGAAASAPVASAAAMPGAGIGAGRGHSSPVAARIDGQPLYAFTVDAVWRQRRAAKPALERRAVLDELIAQRLVAAHAKDVSPKQDAGTQVAFSADTVVEDRLAATLRELYGKDIDAAVKALPRGTLESLVIAQPPMAATALEAVFGRQGPLVLEIALTAAQQSQAAAIEVLRYKLPGAEAASITLLDVYRRQNVQGRLALSLQPAAFAVQQARHILANAFLQEWAGQRFGAEAVADLRQAIAEGEAMAALQNLHGIGLHTDAGSALLNRLSAEATPAEIEAFYGQHKDQFARVEKVRARHIRLPDEAQARKAAKALQGGASFATVARSLSRAPDAARGGDLGWIGADEGKDWLASLAFSQQPGKPSAPIRGPVGPDQPAYWEIVLVEERVHGIHPLHSETVRYQASRMIALEKAMRQFGETVDQARRSARIEIVEAQ